jgi:hypothetical protein
MMRMMGLSTARARGMAAFERGSWVLAGTEAPALPKGSPTGPAAARHPAPPAPAGGTAIAEMAG